MIWWDGRERSGVGQLGARAIADRAEREGEKRIHSGPQKGLQPQRFKGNKYEFWYWSN